MGFPKFRLRKRKPTKAEDKRLHEAIQQELGGFLKREDLQEYLDKIKRDERRSRLWESLSSRKKLKVLRYVLARKGVSDGKKPKNMEG